MFSTGDSQGTSSAHASKPTASSHPPASESGSPHPSTQPKPQARPLSTPPAPADALREEKIQKLVSLGFDRPSAMQALEAAGGNEDAAASILFGDSMF